MIVAITLNVPNFVAAGIVIVGGFILFEVIFGIFYGSN